MARLVKDLTGERFSDLKVLRQGIPYGKKGEQAWWCRCICGVELNVVGYSLKNGNTQSCGCLKRSLKMDILHKGNNYNCLEEYALLYASNSDHVVKVDLDDVEKLQEITWSSYKDSAIYMNGPLRRYVHGRNETVSMGSFLFDFPKDKEIDHISRDTSDYRRSNLRLATKSENMKNRTPQRQDKFVGVHKNTNGTWYANITSDGKTYHLGRFSSEIDAAIERDQAAQQLNGEFAVLNLPRSGNL